MKRNFRDFPSLHQYDWHSPGLKGKFNSLTNDIRKMQDDRQELESDFEQLRDADIDTVSVGDLENSDFVRRYFELLQAEVALRLRIAEFFQSVRAESSSEQERLRVSRGQGQSFQVDDPRKLVQRQTPAQSFDKDNEKAIDEIRKTLNAIRERLLSA